MKKTTFNRRNFLYLGATASVGLAASAVSASPAVPVQEEKKAVISRKLGKTGIEVPIVSMGVMRADNPTIVKAAYQLGFRHFDTAHGYQDGRNEEMVGQVLKEMPRKELIIATKIHPGREGLSTEKFTEMIDTSLKRLQMDYVDILYLHAISDVEGLNDPRYIAALKAAKESGKARFIGVSTHTNMATVINAAVDGKFYDIVLTSYNFMLREDKELNAALVRANDAGLGVVGMKNMAGGFLDKEKNKPINCKAALKWALADGLIHTCIPGITTFEMLKDNWSVAQNLELDMQEKNDLQLAMNDSGMFCKGCQSCAGQCPQNLPIPDIMRSYMYNYGYAYPAKAQQTLAELNVGAEPCSLCPSCSVTCRSGFNIREKVSDIARITTIPTAFLV